MAEMMNGNGMEKKYYVKDDDDYASKGTAGTALGLGIAGTALGLLNNPNGILGGLFNGGSNTGNCGCAYTCQDRLSDIEKQHQELFGVYKNQVDTSFSNYKYTRDLSDSILAKHNADAFALFQGYTTATAGLQKQIDELKTQNAVLAATRPLQDQLIMNAIALEAERRQAADCGIIGYTNCSFYPVNIANVTTGTDVTPKQLYNPLSCFNAPTCGCGR
jgi:hypothetical protein